MSSHWRARVQRRASPEEQGTTREQLQRPPISHSSKVKPLRRFSTKNQPLLEGTNLTHLSLSCWREGGGRKGKRRGRAAAG